MGAGFAMRYRINEYLLSFVKWNASRVQFDSATFSTNARRVAFCMGDFGSVTLKPTVSLGCTKALER